MAEGILLYDAQGNPILARGTKAGALRIAKRIPDFAELVQAGRVWGALDTTTTVALVARPTTVASLTAQNPAGSDTWKILFGFLMYTDVVPATLGMVSLWQCTHKLQAAVLTRDLVLQGTGAGTAFAYRGLKSYDGDLILDRGATVVDDGWVPVGESLESNIATTNFVAKEIPLRVPVILPPGASHSLQTTATVVTFETSLGYIWAEVSKEELE